MRKPSRNHLIALRDEVGLTKADIASLFKSNVKTVTRWFRQENLKPTKTMKLARLLRRAAAGGGQQWGSDTALFLARVILGGSLIERIGYGYYLNGRPIRSSDILLAAADRIEAESDAKAEADNL